MPPPDDAERPSHGKLPAAAAPARIEIYARAGGLWQTVHSEAVDVSSLASNSGTSASPPAAGPADPAATAAEQDSSATTALPGSPEPHSSSRDNQAAVSSDVTELPNRGRGDAEPRRGPLARAMSLREAYGGTSLGQQAAAEHDLQSSSQEGGGAPVRIAHAKGAPSTSGNVACTPGEPCHLHYLAACACEAGCMSVLLALVEKLRTVVIGFADNPGMVYFSKCKPDTCAVPPLQGHSRDTSAAANSHPAFAGCCPWRSC